MPPADQYPRTENRIQMPPDAREFTAEARISAAGSCHVWSGHLADGTRAFLKQYPETRSWLQEQQALKQWLPRLSPELAHLPQILAEDPSEKTLLLSSVPGEIVEQIWSRLEQQDDVMKSAGAFLRALHDLPIEDTDEMPLSDSLPMRLESWIKNHDNSLSEDEICTARKRVGNGTQFEGDTRVPCHNDFQPRNWLWNGSRLGVIDFEHAHINHPAFDWIRMETGIWLQQPRLRDCFIDGYGMAPSWSAGSARDAVAAIHAIGCIVWGTRHEDESLVSEGRRILH